jgi:branched-chain amino acid transport system permease protein
MSVLMAQLLIGLVNGAFYALMSLGLAVIFGMLRIANFAHGAQYMIGAFFAFFLIAGIDFPVPHFEEASLKFTAIHVDIGLNYWWALVIVPPIVGGIGIVLERILIRWIYSLDHMYGMLLTLGMALVIQGFFRNYYGSSGVPYPVPDALKSGYNLGFMYLPTYRAWVVVASLAICLATWYVIERTRLGSHLRAATENPTLVRALGRNVPLMMTLTYGFGVALAAVAGIMAAPIYSVSPLMGTNLIIVVFAVVVIGGMGSIMGAIVTGFAAGLAEALAKVFYPQAAEVVIFLLMSFVLLVRPAGLFGRTD